MPISIAVRLIQKRRFPPLHGLELRSEFKNHLGSNIVNLLLLLQNLRVIFCVVDQEGISFLDEIEKALIENREQCILFFRKDPSSLVSQHRFSSIEHRNLPFSLRPLSGDFI